MLKTAAHVTIERSEHTRTAWWTSINDDILVVLPAWQVSDHGAESLAAAWTAMLENGGAERAGARPIISFATTEATTRAVRVLLRPGQIIGTLSPSHFTDGLAVALAQLAVDIHASLLASAA